MEDLTTALGTTVPAEAPVAPAPVPASYVANKLAVGAEPNVWDRFKDAVGSAQTAIASPLQSAGRSSAKALGASDDTASTVGASTPLVLVVLVVVVVVAIAYKGGKFFGKRSIKL